MADRLSSHSHSHRAIIITDTFPPAQSPAPAPAPKGGDSGVARGDSSVARGEGNFGYAASAVQSDWISSAIGSSPYRDRTVSPTRPELLGLPTDVLIDLIAFMKCEDILKLRLAGPRAKQFIEETIPSIYVRMRRITPTMPVIKFLQAEPGETAVQRTRRAKENVLLFRNECMLAKKTDATPHDLWRRSMMPRHRSYELGREPLFKRSWQELWWEYLVYLKNGVSHYDALECVAYRLPLDLAKQVGSSKARDRFWAAMNRYQQHMRNVGTPASEWKLKLGPRPAKDIGMPTAAQRVYSLTGVAGSGKALDVYNPQMTAGKILASIRLELMTTGEMEDFLRRKKVPGRSKLLRKEDRKAAIAKYIKENVR